jgi:hypothetical protein
MITISLPDPASLVTEIQVDKIFCDWFGWLNALLPKAIIKNWAYNLAATTRTIEDISTRWYRKLPIGTVVPNMQAFGYALGRKEMLRQGVSGLIHMTPGEGETCSVVMGVDQHNTQYRAVVISSVRRVRIVCWDDLSSNKMSEWVREILDLIEPDAFISTLAAWPVNANLLVVKPGVVQVNLATTFYVNRFDEDDEAEAHQAEQAEK